MREPVPAIPQGGAGGFRDFIHVSGLGPIQILRPATPAERAATAALDHELGAPPSFRHVYIVSLD